MPQPRPAIQGLGASTPKPKPAPLPRPKSRVKAKPGLKLLAQAEKKALQKGGGGLASRIFGRLAFRAVPVIGTLAPSAYDVGRMVKEGYGAAKAHEHLKRTAKHVREKYGSIEKATKTRKALRRK